LAVIAAARATAAMGRVSWAIYRKKTPGMIPSRVGSRNTARSKKNRTISTQVRRMKGARARIVMAGKRSTKAPMSSWLLATRPSSRAFR